MRKPKRSTATMGEMLAEILQTRFQPAPIAQFPTKKERHEPQIVGACVICGGNVIEEVKTRSPRQIFEPRVGDPSQPWITAIIGYYCENETCGLRYHHPPIKKV